MTDSVNQDSGDLVNKARRDVIAGGIIVAAILMFIGTGGTVLSQVTKVLSGYGGGPDNVLASALLLNIALILFGWRRYNDLQAEVIERTAAEKRAQQLAATDPLTGLLNRRTIADNTSDLLARAKNAGKSIAFMMLDLDEFKTVNDIHGHEAGDTVLKAISERLREVLPAGSLAARLGGDEFACAVIFDPDRPKTLETVAENLIESIAQPIDDTGLHLEVTTSIGIACADHNQESVNAMIRRADIAMYSAKKAGRNRYCWFDQSMEQELQMRNKLESSMRSGIKNGEFVPYYEQQIDLNTGRLMGFEMLARWESPIHGVVPPEVFVPLAEETSMLSEISADLMRQAFEEARNWDPNLTLSVNISPRQLLDPWLAQKIVKLLVETGFPANRLEVEITESSLFENFSLAQSIIGSLKNQGIRVALDDFGTGYSSLAHLRALPFDRIKVDRSFVSSIRENSESAAIVKAIASLGESLGLPITAEGIENEEIEKQLRTMGCNKGQGWHFGVPLPVQQTRQLLAERNLLPTQRSAIGGKAEDDAQSGDTADEQDAPKRRLIG